jgi:hypothetical protein
MKAAKFYSPFMVTAVSLFMVTAQAEVDPAQAESFGTVVATENAGQYIYVQIDIEGEHIWFAAPASEYSLGEKVVAPPGGLPMKDFYSETLDRTFDMVYFVGKISHVNAPKEEALPPGHPPIDEAKIPTLDEIDLSGIERPEGGKTVAEIHEQQDALAGKPVLVRGKAVKVANGILGKNWIHLRDGSGEEGSNDLTLTTAGIVQVGETITARGTLVQDKDFGSGYKYDVLLEDADIQTK